MPKQNKWLYSIGQLRTVIWACTFTPEGSPWLQIMICISTPHRNFSTRYVCLSRLNWIPPVLAVKSILAKCMTCVHLSLHNAIAYIIIIHMSIFFQMIVSDGIVLRRATYYNVVPATIKENSSVLVWNFNVRGKELVFNSTTQTGK